MKLARGTHRLASVARAGSHAPARAVSGVAGAMSYSPRGVKVSAAAVGGVQGL